LPHGVVTRLEVLVRAPDEMAAQFASNFGSMKSAWLIRVMANA
jgi:hypothetical protein